MNGTKKLKNFSFGEFLFQVITGQFIFSKVIKNMDIYGAL